MAGQINRITGQWQGCDSKISSKFPYSKHLYHWPFPMARIPLLKYTLFFWIFISEKGRIQTLPPRTTTKTWQFILKYVHRHQKATKAARTEEARMLDRREVQEVTFSELHFLSRHLLTQTNYWSQNSKAIYKAVATRLGHWTEISAIVLVWGIQTWILGLQKLEDSILEEMGNTVSWAPQSGSPYVLEALYVLTQI